MGKFHPINEMESPTEPRDVPRLAVSWPACDATTVHVTFASSGWSVPGLELKRQLDGEFLLFLGEIKHLDDIYFKFIIDGTVWKVNSQFPIAIDRYGNENNCWTLEEAATYHDSCERRLRRKLTLSNVNKKALCEFALSIHGSVDGYGSEIECVVDEIGTEFTHSELSMSGSWSEIVFLRFQPVGGQPDLSPVDNQPPEERQEGNMEYSVTDNPCGLLNKIYDSRKDGAGEIWVAKFPADLDHKMLPYKSPKEHTNSERGLLMESECATLRFLNQYTKVPAPQIYAYDVRYRPATRDETEMDIESPDLGGHDWEPIADNRVGWPFILLGGLGSTPSWLQLGSCLKEPLHPNDSSDTRFMTMKQIIMYRMELAEHPLSACGYLTLNKPFWQIKRGPNCRSIRTTKAEFGIRPCIYDSCEPFTESIVSAFDVPSRDRYFPPVSPFRSLDSITAYYRHLINHGSACNMDEFVALWQMRSMLYELFSSRYEYGPFILQYPDISRQNIVIAGHLFDWEGTKAVPIQVAVCPPRMCLLPGWYETGPVKALARYKAECPDIMALLGVSGVIDDKTNPVHFCGKETFLSLVVEENLLLPMVLLSEICKQHPSLIGKTALKTLPRMFKIVRGYEWAPVKEAAMKKGVLKFVLQDWLEGKPASKSVCD